MMMKLDEQIRVTKRERSEGEREEERVPGACSLGREWRGKSFAVALSARKLPRDMVYNIIRGGASCYRRYFKPISG